jgi:hypothetical protein
MTRTAVACRPTSVWSVVGVLACVAAALALSATPALAAECPNEQLRRESNINPATGQPYSMGLPDCRAYEMVSPLDKQGHDATALATLGAASLAVAPNGDTAGFGSEGAFAEPEAWRPSSVYLSQRGASGWITASAFAPRNLIDAASLPGLDGDSTPDLRSLRGSCGLVPESDGVNQGYSDSVRCALRELDGLWVPTPLYTSVTDTQLGANGNLYRGGSSDLSRVFIQPNHALLEADHIQNPDAAGIYEIAGLGTESPELRLVNVDNEGHELVLDTTGLEIPPLLGDNSVTGIKHGGESQHGSEYHAISESGETVFFTATPPSSHITAVYARIGASKTVEVSTQSPKECTGTCASSAPANATFQGASADGSRVFFTTKQELLNSDHNTEYELYEYHFLTTKEEEEGKKPLILISGGESGTHVKGVLRSSPDGSHVYFLEDGVLTPGEKNGNGEEPSAAGNNLYGYDTLTGQIKFVAHALIEEAFEPNSPKTEEGILGDEVSFDRYRPAQTTPDGHYLVFSSSSQLAGDTSTGEAVYRYDFATGELTWISQAAPQYKAEREAEGKSPNPNEGESAFVAPLEADELGAYANFEDYSRAISGCPKGVSEEEREQCPEGEHDGEYIIFMTTEKLQADDENKALDVYEWHCSSPCEHPASEGTVSMISDGHDPQGINPFFPPPEEAAAAMSASGSDIFFTTHTRLVGQDTDDLRDVYDARVDGGFPAPPVEPSCSGEACQRESSLPSFGSATSSSFPAAGNLAPPPAITVATSKESKPKPLTRAQELAKALKACKGKSKKKRAVCESQARKKYGAKAKAKTKAKAIKSARRGR